MHLDKKEAKDKSNKKRQTSNLYIETNNLFVQRIKKGSLTPNAARNSARRRQTELQTKM